MELTEEQQAAYLCGKGVRCPFCLSEQIESGTVEADADTALSDVTCHACGSEWTDRYQLVGLEPSRVA